MKKLSAAKVVVLAAFPVMVAGVAASALHVNRTADSNRTRATGFVSGSAVCLSDVAAFRIFFQDQLGISADFGVSARPLDGVADFVLDGIARSARAVSKQSLEQFVARHSGRSRPAVILGPDGAAAVVAGVVLDDQRQPRLQILDTGSHCYLESIARLCAAGFRDAWVVDDTDSLAAELKFGMSTVELDHTLVNLGLIKPMTDVPCTFEIANSGDLPIVIGRIRSSCGCTSISPKSELELHPGASEVFHVEVSSGDRGSCVHHVDLTLFETGSGDSTDVRVTVCGNVLDSFVASPQSIDFGSVNSLVRQPVKRVVRLIESDSDRFEITSAKSKDSKLNLSWTRMAASDVERQGYMLIAECDVHDMGPGRFSGEIVVTTTSTRRQEAIIPYRGEVRSNFEAIPSVASFGMVNEDSQPVKRIMIAARYGETPDVLVTASPDWSEIEIVSDDNQIVVNIQARPKEKGYQFGELKMKLTSDICTDDIVVPCSVCVRPQKGPE